MINPRLNMIAAVTRNMAIGKDNKLLCREAADMTHFKLITLGQNVVAGRKNHESIPERFRPLPNRAAHIVLTRDQMYRAPGCQVLFSGEQVLYFAEYQTSRETWIIGGAEIYKLFLPYVSRLVITHIEATLEGDAFFPPIESDIWEPAPLFRKKADSRNEYPFTVVEYTRKTLMP